MERTLCRFPEVRLVEVCVNLMLLDWQQGGRGEINSYSQFCPLERTENQNQRIVILTPRI